MAVANIVLTGLTANDAVPGNYIEINWAVGDSGGFQGEYPILLIGNKTAAGDAVVDAQVYGPLSDLPAQTEADVITRFGAGSELHRMWRRVAAVNKETSCFLLAVTESAGAAATLAITWTTTALAAGSTRVWVGDEYVDVAIATGDTPIVIATAAKALVNAKTHWAVTADNAAGTSPVLTLTAKNKGPRGNFLRGSAATYGSGVGTTVSPSVPTVFAGGTVEDDYTAALATILARRFYYVVSAANNANAGTQLSAVISQVNDQAMPTVGIRQRVIAGSTASYSTAATLAAARNATLGELVWSGESDWTPAELAANQAAVYSLFESGSKPRNNWSGFGLDEQTQNAWRVPAPRSGFAPTRAMLKTLLNNGVTPIGVADYGRTYIVKGVTMRSLTGAQPDYRIRDRHRVTQLHRFADDIAAKLAKQFTGKDLGDDLKPGQKPPDGNLVTPLILKAALFRLIDDYVDSARFKRGDTIKANTIVQRSLTNPNRIEIKIPAELIDILDSTATVIEQRS